ncbi:SpoIIE family protein phosphatase [Caminibacter pacificus]|uniref:PAS domain S-box-containing protein n=1 Tax=Caminibacter pacificus TaxID=1424653 RepID=A0AAJ4RE75_9BACT|nr:SpoIIE family protein phosphatase [Caminibacter pacificus]QCI28331.1 PAS domain-containing protein [Caminibacter pacificus]ROR40949.1 PAS domain S-box-containing protein [Caminibacter pacificus]
MVKFRNSIIFKVISIIVVSQLIIWFWLITSIKDAQREILNSLNTQQKEFVIKFIEEQKQKTIKKTLESLKKLIKYSQAALSYSLFNYEEGSAKKIISDVLLEEKSIKAVEVYDTVGKSIFISAYKKDGKKIFTKNKLPKNFEKYKYIKTELIYNSEPIGFVKIYYDLSPILKHLEEIQQKELELVNLKFEKIYKETQKKEKKLFVYFIIAAIFTLLFLLFILIKFINIPLMKIKAGLERFFNFLSDPKQKIEPIDIDTNDEFGEIAKFTNQGISVSSKLHRELAELVDVIDKNIMICEFDENGNVIEVTTAFMKVCGYSKDEINNKRKEVLCNVDLKKIIKTVEKEGNWNGEVKCKTKYGKELWLKSNITKKCSYENNSCRYINILFNVTDKKELEKLKNHLEELVEIKTSKIKQLLNMTKESIRYASLIQKAILPSHGIFKKAFKDYLIIWEPKDVLGGDIYFLDEVRDGEYILMLADCTGHGVHGALMTMLVKAIQIQIINELSHTNKEISTSKILSKFNKSIKEILKQYDKDSNSNAGFDGAIIYYDKNKNIIKFSSANLPLFFIKDNNVDVIRGDKSSVGDVFTPIDYKFKEFEMKIHDELKLYLTTDGFLDQIGGEKELPFGKERFKKLILKYQNLDFIMQKEMFLEELKKYQKDNPRTDDIAVIGLKL